MLITYIFKVTFVGIIHGKLATLHYINLSFIPHDCGMKERLQTKKIPFSPPNKKSSTVTPPKQKSLNRRRS